MPTISEFYGIKITMNYNDHLPPHFHAEYQDDEAILEIRTGAVTGRLPRRALNLIWAWTNTGKNYLRIGRAHNSVYRLIGLIHSLKVPICLSM